MKIVERYSHLNGEEYLLVHRRAVYDEIKGIIKQVDASKLITKVSREKTMRNKRLYSPSAINAEFTRLFNGRGWKESRYQYYVTTNREYMQDMLRLPLSEQKEYLRTRGVKNPISSYKQTDFVKDRIAVEVQFGKYAFVAFDLFVKHLLFYSGDVIDVGIEILPVMAMAKDPQGGRMLSTGIAYFEGEVYNIMRHGRSSPPVPLLIIGIGP
jgi:hypothetical protein